MMYRDYGANGTKPAMATGNFTPEELARLNALRSNFRSRAEYLERVIDDRRLEFALWLKEHGKLNEDESPA
jgi:hypothetical protein